MSRTALIIDDDDLLLNQIARYLRRHGWQVQTAQDGEEGAVQFDQQPAEIVVTDIVMPGREGLETIHALRKQHPQLPIIAISGGLPTVNMDCLGVARSMGANAVMAKPLRLPELMALMDQLLPEP